MSQQPIPVPKIILLEPAKGKPQEVLKSADLRWARVEEFLRSRELAANTRKAYERELKRFLSWTPKGWQDITHRDLDLYKEYLRSTPTVRGGKPLLPPSIEPWQPCKASSSG